jgi:beta-N-acetylhexosaminidase
MAGYIALLYSLEVKTMVSCGLDRLLARPADAPKGRIGLITNHSAVTRNLVPAVDALRAAGINIVALYGPEHGVRGDAAAGQLVDSGTDARTGLPVHSLYGATRKPLPEMLEGVDALLFDLQDVGARYYTFLYTLSYCMQAAGENAIPITVLDRPNPIGGVKVAGNTVKPGFTSFVGMYPIANRHGLTVGELARFYREKLDVRCDLRIVGMEGWRRDMTWEETGLQWVMPSPNIPTVDTARAYPGMCFIEGTQLSEGRGTAKPFEIVGAPYVDGDSLADALNAQNMPGVRWRALHFVPTFSKHKDTPCHGCQLHVTNVGDFRPVETGVRLLATIKNMYPDDFQWLPPFKEGRQPFIDLLAGSAELREGLDAGKSPDEIIAAWAPDLAAYDAARRDVFLYDHEGACTG